MTNQAVIAYPVAIYLIATNPFDDTLDLIDYNHQPTERARYGPTLEIPENSNTAAEDTRSISCSHSSIPFRLLKLFLLEWVIYGL